MKIKGWQLIVLAIIVFILDFFTLGNRQVINNPVTNIIAFIIGLLCFFTFIFGIVKTIRDFVLRNKEVNKTRWEEEEALGVRATGIEINLRRLLAIPLITGAIPLIVLIPFVGFVLSLPLLFLALYLLFNRRYHLIIDSFLVLIGCLLYFVSFSGNPSYFSLYKSMDLYICSGLISPFLAFINSVGPLVITKYFFLTASMFLLAGDIIARLKLVYKKRLNVFSLIVINLVLLSLPFLYIPKIVLGGSEGGDPVGYGQFHFSTNNDSNHMSYDKAFNTYIFIANMFNQDGNNSASITNICVDGKIILITKENTMLQVENGTVINGKILVSPGQTVTIKLISQKPFFVFTLFEELRRYSTSFFK
jgi:hypothetical protein